MTTMTATLAAPQRLQHLTHTELSAAQYFANQYYDKVRYCPELGGWLQYDGTIWKTIDDKAMLHYISRMVDGLVEDLRGLEAEIDEERKFSPLLLDPATKICKILREQIEKLQRQRFAQDVLKWVAGMPQMRFALDDLDAPHRVAHLVNVKNGTLNLNTLELLPHDPAHGFTRVCPVSYLPDAKCPQFEAFLARITGGNIDMMTYLQSLFGASLRGDICEELLTVAIGGGCNGKTTLFGDIIGQILGYGPTGLAYVFEADMLTDMEAGAERPSAMRLQLRGRRLAIFKEPQKGAQFNDTRVKGLCSRDMITARAPYSKEPVSFNPSHTAILLANNLPEVRDCSRAMQRRLCLLPFHVEIPEQERDLSFGQKLLEAEREGIFAWMVEGHRKWVANGQRRPPMPMTARELTQEFFDNADRLKSWIEDTCERKPAAWTSTTDLFSSYLGWLQRCNVKLPPTLPQFARDLREADKRLGIEYTKHPRGGDRGYRGILLKEMPEQLIQENVADESGGRDMEQNTALPY